jgi:protein O-mannosyl-transferase
VILPGQPTDPRTSPGPAAWQPSPWLVGILLVAVTFLVFWPVTRAEFLNYDDPDYFTSNPHVLGGLTGGNIAWAFTTGHAGNWHPLTWLSLMLDVECFGKGPAGPHFTNLWLHAFNAVLLFLLLRRWTGASGPSLATAALFALHPLHVESVAWVAERKDVLSLGLGLLSLWAYTTHVRQGRPPAASRAYWIALLFLALGLMSKPMLVTLPCVMLLLDWWPLNRFEGRDLRSAARGLLVEKLPFFGLAAASSVITYLVQQQSGAMTSLARLNTGDRLANAFVSYARYLGKVFWPEPLATPYPHPGQWPPASVALGVGLVAGLTLIAVRLARRHPFVFTGWGWFAGTLVPVIGVIQVGSQAMADRYTYLPSIGLFVLLAWGAETCGRRWNLPRAALGLMLGVALLAAGAQTRRQLGHWQNSETLFRHALAVTPANHVAANNLGTHLSSRGRMPEALEAFLLAYSFKADNADTLYNLGNAFTRLGRAEDAVRAYEQALALAPGRAEAMNNLGFALASLMRYDEAVTWLKRSLDLKPDSVDAHNNLAGVHFFLNQFEEAVRQYQEAARLAPENPQIQSNLGDALVRLGRLAEAVQCYQTVLRLKPDDARARARLQALGPR